MDWFENACTYEDLPYENLREFIEDEAEEKQNVVTDESL